MAVLGLTLLSLSFWRGTVLQIFSKLFVLPSRNIGTGYQLHSSIQHFQHSGPVFSTQHFQKARFVHHDCSGNDLTLLSLSFWRGTVLHYKSKQL
jgi:hypothetical protein